MILERGERGNMFLLPSFKTEEVKPKMAENTDKILEAIELARNTGKIKKGSNEVTKSLERGSAKLVVTAQDVQPKEVIMHIPMIAKEKNILCLEVPSKDDLGAAAGLGVPTTAVAITEEGEAKKVIAQLTK